MGQANFVLSGTLLDGIKGVQQTVTTLSEMEASAHWPQTENINKAEAALIDRFLEDDFGIKPIPVQPGENDKS